MNVYCVKPTACGCGGCAIVAATSEKEALRLVNESTDIYKDNYIDLYAKLVFRLHCETRNPYIICDEIYIEDI